jgi:hypothetical protein
MGKLPAIWLYPGDWLQDEIAGCSLAAQGLLLRMMFIGHSSTRYGYLVNSDGAAIPPESIARRCGCTPEQYATLLIELDSVGKLNRTPEGIVFIKRMVRDAASREQGKNRVVKHRLKRSCNADVTPIEDETVIEISEVGLKVLKPDYKPAFLLEDFDSEGRFYALCDVYPKPNKSHLGVEAYIRAIEPLVTPSRPDRNEIADAIEQAAVAYAQAKRGSAKQFIPQLITWLDKAIWQQDPAMWEETVGTPKQRALANGIDEAFS